MSIKYLWSIVYCIVFSIVIIFAGISALTAFPLFGKFNLLVVQTGSMEPAVEAGSLILVRGKASYSKGDVITFKLTPLSDLKNPKSVVTHRIVSIKKINGEIWYTTKGDANNVVDMRKISEKLVVGKVLFSVPLLGYPISYAKTQTGFVLLIVIPATLIVYSELVNIKSEAKRLMEERKKRKLSALEKLELSVDKDIGVVEQKIKRSVRKTMSGK